MTKELLQQALDALKFYANPTVYDADSTGRRDRITFVADDAIIAIEAAIAQPEQPAAYIGVKKAAQILQDRKAGIPPTPAQPVQPAKLTNEEIETIAKKHEAFGFGLIDDKGLTTHGFDPEGMHDFARELLAQPVLPPQNHVWAVASKVAFMLFWSESAARQAGNGGGSTYMDVQRIPLLDVPAQPKETE